MAHRVGAFLIFTLAAVMAWQALNPRRKYSFLSKFALTWFGMIALQALLGATTVWTKKAADIATLHVVLGAGCLVVGSLVTVVAARVCPETLQFELPATASPATVTERHASPEATTV